MLLHATLRMGLWFAVMSHVTRTSCLHLDAGVSHVITNVRYHSAFLRFFCTTRWSAEQAMRLPALVSVQCHDASLRLMHLAGVLIIAGVITLQGRSTCEV